MCKSNNRFRELFENIQKSRVDLKIYLKWITKLYLKIYPWVYKQKISEEGTPYFSVVADKVTDCESSEYLGILIRYVYQQRPVERLIEYVKWDNIIGEIRAYLKIESLKRQRYWHYILPFSREVRNFKKKKKKKKKNSKW